MVEATREEQFPLLQDFVDTCVGEGVTVACHDSIEAAGTQNHCRETGRGDGRERGWKGEGKGRGRGEKREGLSKVHTDTAIGALTLQASGGGEGLADVGGEQRLQCWPRPHVHAGTHVEVGVDKERETAQETPTRAAGRRGEGRGSPYRN